MMKALYGLLQADRPTEAPLGGMDETHAADDGPRRTNARRRPSRDAVTRIGRFSVLSRLGHGGMGAVYAAYDEKLDRRIAVKVLFHNVGDAARVRVEREARSMARLTHPNVVQVYEVGEDDGEIYIAMEFVEGSNLYAWQDAEPRSWSDTMGVYRQAGEGLAAAHAAGLVHRDFKPHNAMVSLDGTVKVVDFGLARTRETLSPSTTIDTAATTDAQTGKALSITGGPTGTPAYMAPEQFASGKVGEAADQFSFCVSLWEALFGQPPFEGESVTERFTAVTQGNWRPVPKDSKVPVWIKNALVRGLATAPEDRWPSMHALLAVLDRDPRRTRNRWLTIGVATIGLAAGGAGLQAWWTQQSSLCTGASEQLNGVWDESRRAEVEQAMLAVDVPFAARAWSDTSSQLDDYAAAWVQMHTDACEATSIRGTQSGAMMDLRMACLHRAKVDLDATVGVLAEADEPAISNAHTMVSGLERLERCADTEWLEADIEPPPPAYAETIEDARALIAKAAATRLAGHYAQAHDVLLASDAARHGIDYQPVAIEADLERGRVLSKLGKYDDAETSVQRALDSATDRHQIVQMQDAATEMLLIVGSRLQRADEALHRFQLLAIRLASDDPIARARAVNNVGNVLMVQGKFVAAEARYREALELRQRFLPPGHIETLTARTNLAAALGSQGRVVELVEEQREALKQEEAILGPDHPRVTITRNNLGIGLYQMGHYEEAEALHREAVAASERSLAPDNPMRLHPVNDLANVLFARGKYREAAELHRKTLAKRTELLGPEHALTLDSRNNLANALTELRELDEAESLYRSVIEIRDRTLGSKHPDTASAYYNLGYLLVERGKNREASIQQQRALKIMVESLGEDHPSVATIRESLAATLLDLGDHHGAFEYASLAWARRSKGDVPTEAQARTAVTLARAQWEVDEDPAVRRRARTLASRGLELYEETGEQFADEREKTRTWLAEHPAPE